VTALRIAIVGDLHTHFDDIDVAQFAHSDYDLIFFVGDLGGGTPQSSLRIARTISRLNRKTLGLPGNNDTGDIAELAAELSHRAGLDRLTRLRTGQAQPAPIGLCGYSVHRLGGDGLDITLIAGRPHSLGGPDLSFPDYMAANYDVADMEASRRRLCTLIDGVESRDLLVFAHNGPTGFGEQPHDMWGCDFKPGGGDWGDPDLAAAIAHARASGKRVHAVVAGHMHLRTKDGTERPWLAERDGIIYVNSARVPRIIPAADGVLRHHIALVATVEQGVVRVAVEEVLLPS
jgi:uncharacterized protein (TIGR04168 family)